MSKGSRDRAGTRQTGISQGRLSSMAREHQRVKNSLADALSRLGACQEELEVKRMSNDTLILDLKDTESRLHRSEEIRVKQGENIQKLDNDIYLLTSRLGTYRSALEGIAKHPHCIEPNEPTETEHDRSYRMGVVDGHRCASSTASKVLDSPVEGQECDHTELVKQNTIGIDRLCRLCGEEAVSEGG